MKHCLVLASLFASVAVLGCDAPTALDTALSPIVGGEPEAGYQPVGALVQQDGDQYQGNFCTATLIATRWVLTAAHCVAGRGLAGSFFYLGPDARPPGGGRRPEGRFMAFGAIHVHPRYRGDALIGIYDIALVELAEPVDDVPPYALATTAPNRNEALVFVGFGASDGAARSGSGLKRRTTLAVADVAPAMLVSAAMGTGVCYGDSGGPGLRAIDGGFEVVGVNSSIVGQGDCLGASLQVRADAQLTWVHHVMGDDPSCGQNPEEICGCADACLPEGFCDGLACGPREGCRLLAECLGGCGGRPACSIRCYGEGEEAARRRYEAVVACGQEHCGDADDVNACLQERCPEPWTACLEDWPPGEDDCATLLACSGACRTRQCQLNCYSAGTAEARAGLDALSVCVADACAEQAGDSAAYNACAQVSCGDAWRACDPPDDCALTGGDCGDDAACLPAPWGGHYCRAAGDLQEGQVCNPDFPSCRDGLFCAPGSRRCRPVCIGDGDCEAGQACALIDDAPEPFGTCQPVVVPMPDAGLEPDAAPPDAAVDAAGDAAGDAVLDSAVAADALPPDAAPDARNLAVDAMQAVEDTGELPPADAAPVDRTVAGGDGCQVGGRSSAAPLVLLGLVALRRRRR